METAAAIKEKKKVLVVAHGSRSAGWVAAQRAWFAGVQRHLGADVDAELTFLEIAPPLFEERLRAFIAQETRGVLIFPFFLSRSGHAGDEIPEIAEHAAAGRYGLVAPEGWEEMLGRNAERRLRAWGATAEDQVIVSGYGASHHDHLWRELLVRVQAGSGLYAAGAEWLWAPSA